MEKGAFLMENCSHPSVDAWWNNISIIRAQILYDSRLIDCSFFLLEICNLLFFKFGIFNCESMSHWFGPTLMSSAVPLSFALSGGLKNLEEKGPFSWLKSEKEGFFIVNETKSLQVRSIHHHNKARKHFCPSRVLEAWENIGVAAYILTDLRRFLVSWNSL